MSAVVDILNKVRDVDSGMRDFAPFKVPAPKIDQAINAALIDLPVGLEFVIPF